jgi:predicted membrane-bound spermidine synthase
MEGVAELYKQNEQQGLCRIERFTISNQEAEAYNFGNLLNGCLGMNVSPGEYVKLYVNGQLYMSDTDMERSSNQSFVQHAYGDVMVAGLGIGLILNALREKIDSGDVRSITVYEKYQDVIDVVGPKLSDLPIKIVCADILEYRPPKDEHYDTIYFDIWPDINTKNLKEIYTLHRRWIHRLNPGGWINSWMEEHLQYMNRR